MRIPANRRRGFSLVEVNLAILLIGLGMLVLFGLFPAGLREADNAFIDTHAAQFAEVVMNGLRATTQGVVLWTDWTDGGAFQLEASELQGIANIQGQPVAERPGVSQWVEFPLNSGTYVRYLMAASGAPTNRVRGVNLWVWSGKYGPDDPADFRAKAEWYYTKYYYSGVE